MTDLIYGGYKYQDEIKSLFKKVIIEDASDDIHLERISIEIPDIEEKEYWRIMTLNGFIEMSLNLQLIIRSERSNEFKKEFDSWKKNYPEYFKQ